MTSRQTSVYSREIRKTNASSLTGIRFALEAAAPSVPCATPTHKLNPNSLASRRIRARKSS